MICNGFPWCRGSRWLPPGAVGTVGTVGAVGSCDYHPPPVGGGDIVVRSDSLQRPRAEPRPLEGIPVFENPTFHGWCGFKDSPPPPVEYGTHPPLVHDHQRLSTAINGCNGSNGFQRQQRFPTAATAINDTNGCNGWGKP